MCPRGSAVCGWIKAKYSYNYRAITCRVGRGKLGVGAVISARVCHQPHFQAIFSWLFWHKYSKATATVKGDKLFVDGDRWTTAVRRLDSCRGADRPFEFDNTVSLCQWTVTSTGLCTVVWDSRSEICTLLILTVPECRNRLRWACPVGLFNGRPSPWLDLGWWLSSVKAQCDWWISSQSLSLNFR